jgi:hypothetical protein
MTADRTPPHSPRRARWLCERRTPRCLKAAPTCIGRPAGSQWRVVADCYKGFSMFVRTGTPLSAMAPPSLTVGQVSGLWSTATSSRRSSVRPFQLAEGHRSPHRTTSNRAHLLWRTALVTDAPPVHLMQSPADPRATRDVRGTEVCRDDHNATSLRRAAASTLGMATRHCGAVKLNSRRKRHRWAGHRRRAAHPRRDPQASRGTRRRTPATSYRGCAMATDVICRAMASVNLLEIVRVKTKTTAGRR